MTLAIFSDADRKVLQRIADAGSNGAFLSHPAHEKRAWYMSEPDRALVKREKAVWRMSYFANGEQLVVYRNLYTVKPEGKRLLGPLSLSHKHSFGPRGTRQCSCGILPGVP